MHLPVSKGPASLSRVPRPLLSRSPGVSGAPLGTPWGAAHHCFLLVPRNGCASRRGVSRGRLLCCLVRGAAWSWAALGLSVVPGGGRLTERWVPGRELVVWDQGWGGRTALPLTWLLVPTRPEWGLRSAPLRGLVRLCFGLIFCTRPCFVSLSRGHECEGGTAARPGVALPTRRRRSRAWAACGAGGPALCCVLLLTRRAGCNLLSGRAQSSLTRPPRLPARAPGFWWLCLQPNTPTAGVCPRVRAGQAETGVSGAADSRPHAPSCALCLRL